jgi:hypothetical protein
VFEHVAVTQPSDLNYTGGEMPEGLRGAAVSREWFEVFGIRPAFGHTFAAEDDQPNAAPTVVLSHAIWQRLFGGDVTVLGRTVLFDQKPYKVLGVMPADFSWPRQADVWVPLGLPPAELTEDYRFNEHLTAVARIRPGITTGRADARVRLIAEHVRAVPGDNAAFARSSRWDMFALHFTDYVAGDTKWPMLVLLGAVGFVLLIACSNIAGLVLARTAGS